MTQDLFRQDAYLRECSAHITAVTDAGIVLDQTVFYPLGGGQAGDSGDVGAAFAQVGVLAEEVLGHGKGRAHKISAWPVCG